MGEYENNRIEALRRLGILDSAPEERFDRLVELAAEILDVPIALVSLVDTDRQWFKARLGIDEAETARDISFCSHAIDDGPGSVLVVEDASVDARFADNPLVTGDHHIRFYAGCVVSDPKGFAVGTICAIDSRPRVLTPGQRRSLVHLGKMVEEELARAEEIERFTTVTESERRRTMILETMSEGVVLQSAEGEILEWNSAAERVLGLTTSDLDGLSVLDPFWSAVRVDGSPWPPETFPVMEAIRTKRPVHGSLMGLSHEKVGGEVRWLSINARPVFDADGSVTHGLTVFADMTSEVDHLEQRRGIEDKLAQSERLASVSLDSLEQGVILTDADGYIERMNPAARRIMGYSSDEVGKLIGDPTWDVTDEFGVPLTPDERPVVRARSTGETISDAVIGLTRRDGNRVLLRLSVVPDADGKGGVLIAFTDVTERHRAEQVLDATFETAPVGLALLDEEHRVVRCNSSFADQAGGSADELIGRQVSQILETNFVEDEATPLVDENSSSERRVLRVDGVESWVRSYSATIADTDPPVTIAAIVDVTSERRMLNELARYGRLFHYAEDLVTVIDSSGSVLFASPSSARLAASCGGDRSDFFAMIHSHDRALVESQVMALVDGGDQTGPFTYRVVDEDAVTHYIECVAVNLLDEPEVAGIVVTGRDVTDRHLLSKQLEHQARHDALTGLGNRRLLDEALTMALDRCARDRTRVGACYIDLDGFKSINDRRGHAVGDQLLKAVADVITGAVRRSDVAVRIGGDEFVLLMHGVGDGRGMIEVAHRIRNAVVELDIDGVRVGASFGLALSVAGDTPQSLLHRADSSLYRAKRVRSSQIDVADVVGSAAPLQ